MATGFVRTTALPPDPPFSDVSGTARDLVVQAYSFGTAAQQAAHALAEQLAPMAGALAIPVIEVPDIPVGVVADPAMPPTPERPAMATFPNAPEFAGGGSVAMPSFADAPVADIDYPSVDLSIAPPSALSASAPAAPDVPQVDVPDAPALALPDVPSLASVVIPDIPTITLPEFDAALGDSPLAPDTSFSFTESAYTSDLLDGYRGLLASWIEGAATGIAPEVEAAIWDRARDRESRSYGDAMTEVARTFAGRGFPLPPAAAASLAHQAIQKAREAGNAVSRDIAIKQAELEQSNRHFALSEARQIEIGLMGYASQIAQRAFEAARYVVEAAVAVYGARVQQYNADVQAFVARAGVYRERIAGEIAKLEVYRAQIEGQRLVASLNEQTVAIYRARLEGVQTRVSIYEQEVRAASVRAEIARNEVEIFRTRTAAYGEQVRAKAAEYDAYATRVKAEVSKLEVPRVQAEVFRALTDGYAAQVRGQTEAKALEVKLQSELPLQEFATRVEAFNGSVRAVGEQVRAIADMYRADASVFEAQVRGAVGVAEVQTDRIRAEVAAGTARAQVSVEASRANVQSLLAQTQIMLEAAKAQAGAVSQLAAGAMSVLNMGASIGGSSTMSANQSRATSVSDSFGVSHNYNHSD